jgi:hypothetical protein
MIRWGWFTDPIAATDASTCGSEYERHEAGDRVSVP